MSNPEISCGNVCIGRRRWFWLENEEGNNRLLLSRYRSVLFSGIANAAISYNVVNISLSLASMELDRVKSRAMEGEILSMMIAGMIGE